MTDYPDIRSPALIRTLIIIFKNFLSAAQALLCTPGVSNRRVFREVSHISLSTNQQTRRPIPFCFTDRAAGTIS
jgi:hypothetical protein